MSALGDEFRKLCAAQLDISQHLGFLRGLACDPDVRRVVEFGFRTGVSATALATAGKPLISYDVEPCTAAVRRLRSLAANFAFKMESSLKAVIGGCDLLHIDSLHTYAQLRDELELHHEEVTKWIVMHDTETFGLKGKDGSKPGLKMAINGFLQDHPEWEQILHLTHNNGMTLLERRGPSTRRSARDTTGSEPGRRSQG